MAPDLTGPAPERPDRTSATDPPLPDATRRSVIELMARLAAGDHGAMFELVDRHGHRIAGVLRRHLRSFGVYRIDPDELRGLVLDAAEEIARVAGAWRRDGAMPWSWADARIRHLVSGWVGVFADSIDEQVFAIADVSEPAASEEGSLAEVWSRLAAEVPLVGELAEAARAARVDEVALLCVLDYRIHHDQGDPSPSHTLAARYGLSPDALRQRVSRNRRRLRRVVDADERFAALAEVLTVA